MNGLDHLFLTRRSFLSPSQDNTVTLSTMKASRFYLAFEKELTYWEKSLAHVSNTIEMILQVQRQWMYLENIFVGSEDIRKQLPGESAMFDSVNTAFVDAMKGLYDTKNVLKGESAGFINKEGMVLRL